MLRRVLFGFFLPYFVDSLAAPDLRESRTSERTKSLRVPTVKLGIRPLATRFSMVRMLRQVAFATSDLVLNMLVMNQAEVSTGAWRLERVRPDACR